MSSRTRPTLCALLLLAPLFGPRAQAQVDRTTDWWQWGGPHRTFVVDDPGLADSWEERGPIELFRRELRGGHATVSTGDGRVFVLHGRRGGESLLAMTFGGVVLWEKSFDVSYRAGNSSHDGPHAAPLVLDDKVVTVSIDATLRAWKPDDGELLWERDLKAEHGLTLPQAGYAASPLVVGDAMLLPGLGGPGPGLQRTYADDLGIFKLALADGQLLWRKERFSSSHASPILLPVEPPQAVFHGMEELVSVSPETGDVLWRWRLRDGAADNVSFMPVWDAESRSLLLSHAYDRDGAQAVRLAEGAGSAERAWANPRLKVQHGNGLLWNGIFLASDGDSPGFLTALDASTGEMLWKERMPKATFLAVESRMVLMLDAEGVLYLAKPSRDGSGIVSKLEVLGDLSWTAPTLVGRTLFLRDPDTLVAFRLP